MLDNNIRQFRLILLKKDSLQNWLPFSVVRTARQRRSKTNGTMKVMLLFSATSLVVIQAMLVQSAAPLIAPESEIRTLLVERVDERKQSVGIVVGIIEPAGKRVVSYGCPATNDRRPLDGDSCSRSGRSRRCSLHSC